MKNRLLYLFVGMGLVLSTIGIAPMVSAGITAIEYDGEPTYSDFDINMDGAVDQTDADMLTAAYGQTGDPGWIREDINKDGAVNYLDASGLVNHIGETYDPYEGVPKIFYVTTEDSYVNWDINMDGIIDQEDSELLQESYGQSGDPGWIREDIVRDGYINYLDASAFVNHYGETYDTNLGIQDAIDLASDGDTILAASGTYYENIIVDKTVKIIGENHETTIIDGSNQDYAVKIVTNGVELTEFTVTNASLGLLMQGDNNKIHENIFKGNELNAMDNHTNTYERNYWDDYKYWDDDEDGIGDLPHLIYGGDNKDTQVLGYFNEKPSEPPNPPNPPGSNPPDSDRPVNNAPAADFSWTLDALQVDFTDLSTDSDGTIVSWSWNFGDEELSIYQNPTHIYANSGTYIVTLNVTDNNGAANKIHKTIKVSSSNVITAIIDIDPNTLNVKSNGRWITSYIGLPEGYAVDDIDISTILLNGQVQAEIWPIEINDYDNDGTPELKIKFNRSAVIQVLEVGGEVELIVTGELTDGTLFQGTDSIRVINQTTKHQIEEQYNVTLTQDFYATDIDNDEIVDMFTDPNGVLSPLDPVTINGDKAFLISIDGDEIPEFFWSTELDTITPISHAPATVVDTYTMAEEIKVLLTVDKGKWIYIDAEDQYPHMSDLTVKTSDGRIISSDMIWRENGKIFVLDDPDTEYQFIYYNPIGAGVASSYPTMFTGEAFWVTLVIILIAIILAIVSVFVLQFRKNQIFHKKIDAVDEKIKDIDQFIKEKRKNV